MAVGEVAQAHRKTPLWANPMAWALVGALAGAGIFIYSQRQGLDRAARLAARRGTPLAQASAKKLAVAAEGARLIARDLAKDAGLAEEPEAELPHGLSGAELAAPTDPTGLKRPTAHIKSRRRLRSASGDMPNAGQVQDVRARWDAPDVSYEAPVPWMETDMARGVIQTGSLAIGFWLMGYILLSVTGGKPRSF